VKLFVVLFINTDHHYDLDSETVPHLSDLKDGASWAALEYAKNIRDPQSRRMTSDGHSTSAEPQDVMICIAGIGYSDKTKYRSSAVME